MQYRPEGCIFDTEENKRLTATPEGLTEAIKKGIILEARALMCTNSHDLIVDLPCAKGIIRRIDGAEGIKEGSTRDIALISRVNKIVCFKVKQLYLSENNELTAELSRKAAQEECAAEYISSLAAGDIIEARVTHHEKFGSFVDIGCGLPSLLPIDTMSVSRIVHPSDRFKTGQLIKVIVNANVNGRIYLTHKELLGTWSENAALFSPGETVPGIVRSVEEYGIFIELTPNLAGLAEPREGIVPGDSVSVYIKTIIPDKMKIKLIIVDVCDCSPQTPLKYFINSAHIDRWEYSTSLSEKNIYSDFR